MIRSEDVFPRSNLPDVAVPWGRVTQDRIVGVEKAVEALQGTLGNQGRSSSGSLSLLGDQVADLQERQSYSVEGPGVLLEMPGAGWYSGTSTVTLPTPSKDRTAMLLVSTTTLGVVTTGGGSLFVEVLFGDSQVVTDKIEYFITSQPPSFVESQQTNSAAPIRMSPFLPTTVTVRYWGTTFSNTLSTFSLAPVISVFPS